MDTTTRSPRWPLLVAILLTLAIAALVRLIRLPDLPAGLHYDEAANGILAAEIARSEKRPIFISSYTGKEVLFFYWAAAWMKVLGEGMLALRLASAVAGLCTVVAAAWSTYELLSDRRDAQWVGTLSAAFLATSFWHLILSRVGFRAITQPLLQALTVGALWRGLRLERKRWLILAGLFGGATAYTYLAARAFPVPLAAALLALLAADRAHRRARLREVLILAAAGAVALAPLAAYFATHPSALTTRMSQVAATSWAEVWQGVRACLRMFFIQGDPYIRFNLPGRPLFDPVTASLFVLGIAMVLIELRRSIRASTATPRLLAARVFLLTSVPVMILPSALATGDITPSNLRAVGLLPFVYTFPALALSTLVHLLPTTTHNPPLTRLSPASLVLITLVLTAISTTPLYFRDWAPSPQLYDAADGDLVEVSAYLNRTDLTGVTPYVASIHYRHPTLAFLADDYPTVKWLRGGETLVIPAEGQGLLILPRSADDGQAWILEHIGAGAHLSSPAGPDGQPAFQAYRVQARTPLTPTQPLTANFAHAARLMGYDLPGGEPWSEGRVEVIVYWQVEAQPEPGDLLPTLRLTDQWGSAWGQIRPFHYPSEQWTPGELVLDRVSVPVQAGAPPGAYQLQFGFYADSTETSFPILDPTGSYAGTAVEIPVELGRSPTPPDPQGLNIRQRLDLATDAGLTLLGANVNTSKARPGEPIRLTLFWEAQRAPEVDVTTRLSLGESTLYEGAPVHGTYPTSLWTFGEVVADRYDPRLDREAEPGTYPLLLTMVDPEGGAVLGPLSLAEVTVEAAERVFEPPPLAHTVDVPLGAQVALLGYDVNPEPPSPGDQVTITLYWQALTSMETSYTIFVHLLGPDGRIAAQHDGIPAAGNYPTNLWVSGEVVTDQRVLTLPAGLAAGSYNLEVGMYVAETGARLPVAGSPDDAIRFQLTLR